MPRAHALLQPTNVTVTPVAVYKWVQGRVNISWTPPADAPAAYYTVTVAPLVRGKWGVMVSWGGNGEAAWRATRQGDVWLHGWGLI